MPSPEREAVTTIVSPWASVVVWSGLDCASAGVAIASASRETNGIFGMAWPPGAGNEGGVLPKLSLPTGMPDTDWRSIARPGTRKRPHRLVVAQTETPCLGQT